MSDLTILEAQSNTEKMQIKLDDRVESLDPSLDIIAEIKRLKKERNAIILAHYYVDGAIQDIADVLGDSLALARAAQETTADVIVFCGVHFMAETAKILNPSKTVVLPDMRAGCSLADSCPPDAFKAFKDEHLDHVVVTYVNTSAAIKALSDYCCTSTNAKAIIESIPEETPIIFAPDVNLGTYLVKETGRDMLIWQGSCIVHETFNEKYVLELLEEYPKAELIAHPECETSILKHAKFIGSTKRLLEYTQSSDSETFIVATESGIIHTMKTASPHKTFIAAAPEVNPEEEGATCGCSTCPYMKLNSLEKLYLCIRDLEPQIHMSEEDRLAALKPLERMVAIG